MECQHQHLTNGGLSSKQATKCGSRFPWMMYDQIQVWACHRSYQCVECLDWQNATPCQRSVAYDWTRLSDVSLESERVITVRKMPDTPAPSIDAVNTSSSDDLSDENPVAIPLRRSTWRKRPPPGCIICDHEIRGQCSSNRYWDERNDLPWRSKRARTCLARKCWKENMATLGSAIYECLSLLYKTGFAHMQILAYLRRHKKRDAKSDRDMFFVMDYIC